MPRLKPGDVQTSAPAAADAAPEPRAGALRRTFEPNPSPNEASPRADAQRRTEPGHEAAPAAPTDHPKE